LTVAGGGAGAWGAAVGVGRGLGGSVGQRIRSLSANVGATKMAGESARLT
jgi:hypothetical protein